MENIIPLGIKSNIKLVVIDCPMLLWKSEGVSDFFMKIISLKLAGYGQEYDETALPIGTTDFYSTHFVAVEETLSGLKPLMGFKSVSLLRSEQFNQPFPALESLQLAGMKDEQKIVTDLIERAHSEGTDLTYNGSWTVSPEARSSRPLAREAKAILTAAVVHYHRDRGIPRWITLGVPRVRTDQHFASMGLKPVTGLFPFAPLSGEPVLMMVSDGYSPETETLAARYRSVWEARIEMSAPLAKKPAKAA